MVDAEQPPLKFICGQTPSFFGLRTSNRGNITKFCNCHPNISVKCNGTEGGSYCLLGCEDCYRMIQAKKKREAEEMKKLRDELNAARRELVQTKDELSRAVKKQRLSKDELERYPQSFQSPIVTLILKHPEAGPTGITYNIHLARLTQASTYFSDWYNSQNIRADDRNLQHTLSYTSTVDHPVPFKYFVDYIYSGTYEVPSSQQDFACLIHVLVYDLANRLKVERLMEFSLENVTRALQNLDGSWKTKKRAWDMRDGANIVSGQIEDRVVVRMAEVVYTGSLLIAPGQEKDYDEAIISKSSNAITIYSVFDDTMKDVNDDVNKQITIGGGEVVEEAAAGEELARTKQSLGLDEPGEVEETTIVEPHPIRKLVSGYAATRLEALNKRSDFRALLARSPQFALDMMIAKESLGRS